MVCYAFVQYRSCVYCSFLVSLVALLVCCVRLVLLVSLSACLVIRFCNRVLRLCMYLVLSVLLLFRLSSRTFVSGVMIYVCLSRLLPPPSASLLCLTSSASIVCHWTPWSAHQPPWSPPLCAWICSLSSATCPHGHPLLCTWVWSLSSATGPHGPTHYAHGSALYRLPPVPMVIPTLHMDLLSIVCHEPPWSPPLCTWICSLPSATSPHGHVPLLLSIHYPHSSALYIFYRISVCSVFRIFLYFQISIFIFFCSVGFLLDSLNVLCFHYSIFSVFL